MSAKMVASMTVEIFNGIMADVVHDVGQHEGAIDREAKTLKVGDYLIITFAEGFSYVAVVRLVKSNMATIKLLIPVDMWHSPQDGFQCTWSKYNPCPKVHSILSRYNLSDGIMIDIRSVPDA